MTSLVVKPLTTQDAMLNFLVKEDNYYGISKMGTICGSGQF
jgi:hypothetical protein